MTIPKIFDNNKLVLSGLILSLSTMFLNGNQALASGMPSLGFIGTTKAEEVLDIGQRFNCNYFVQEKIPENFHIAEDFDRPCDKMEKEVSGSKPNPDAKSSRHERNALLKVGLEALCISGSAQFSKTGLRNIIKRIQENEFYKLNKCSKIAIVDFREEDHFLVGEDCIVEDKKRGRGVKSIIKGVAEEQKKLADGVKFETEEEVAGQLGVGYIHIPIPDHGFPDVPTVDKLVGTLQTFITSNTWVHFHCRCGIGRTSIGMSMYDILKNARPSDWNQSGSSIGTILMRQYHLGGLVPLNLAGTPGGHFPYSKGYPLFLTTFYNYITDNSEGLYSSKKLSWQAWESKRTWGSNEHEKARQVMGY